MKRDLLSVTAPIPSRSTNHFMLSRVFSSVSFGVLALLPTSWHQAPPYGGCLITLTELQRDQIQQKEAEIKAYDIFISTLSQVSLDELSAVDTTRLGYGAVSENQLNQAEKLLRQSWEIDPGKSLLLLKKQGKTPITEEDIRREIARIEILLNHLRADMQARWMQSCTMW